MRFGSRKLTVFAPLTVAPLTGTDGHGRARTGADFARRTVACLALACLTLACLVVFAPAAGAEVDSSPKIIGSVFNIVERKFPHKSQVDFPKMLKKGLDRLETDIDEVLVEWHKDGGGFRMVAGKESREFRHSEPKSWGDLEKIASEAFSFVISKGDPDSGTNEKAASEIEYAIVNGMLSTVDRHSRIIPPRDYEEFIIETEGSFTGLGIVISSRKGWITVVSPIEDTPAYRAGMKSGDRIVQIENESTVNMSIVEAVHRLRGPKGEPVNIRILRDSLAKPKPLTIVRDVIKIESVESQMFSGGVLYLKIKNFQRNTTDSAVEAVKEARKKGPVRGIVLDLRDNPGGLLNQAARISDMFLKYGTVFSVKSGTSVRPYSASGNDKTEVREKTVVLVNAGSASASEIVTGALKENDRALTMGTKTFGKGSIQDIFELGDGSALKLTIGNYLIPGEKSIHKVGITPDIFIEEVDFSKKKVIYKTPEFAFLLEEYRKDREDDEGVRDPDPPVYAFKILNETLTGEDEEEDTEEGPEPPDDEDKRARREKDPLIAAARKIIAETTGIYRSDMLQTAGGILEAIGREEDRRIREKLSGLKVDWAEGKAADGGVDLKVGVTPGEPVFAAGSEGKIKVEVLNAGGEPVHKLTALISSENRLLDGREFVFGRVAPGRRVSWETPVETPENIRTRNDECVIKFFDASGKEVFSKTFAVSFKGSERPAISYNYEIVDDGRFGSKGNGDGRIAAGETVSLLFRIKNSGRGAGEEMGLYLKNRSGKRLFLEKAIEEMGEMAPGGMKDVVMRFRVEERDEKTEKAKFDLTTNDFQIGFSSKYGIEIPVVEAAEFSPESGAVEFLRDTAILGGSFEGAQQIWTAAAGSSYRTEGRAGEWLKIKTGEEAAGWVKAADAAPFEGERTHSDLREALESSPLITLDAFPSVTGSGEIEITGSATDMEPVVNISFFKNNDKIHIINSGLKEQKFAFKVPLEDGLNTLTITAKDSGKLKTIRTFYIRKTS